MREVKRGIRLLGSIAILGLACWPNCDLGCGAQETVLKANLQTIRECIVQYREDHGHGPESLARLVEDGYLRAIPQDPVTESSKTWILVYSDARGPELVDVRSGADGAGSEGTAYSSW